MKATRLTFDRIDSFKQKGFLLGRDKPREVYYIVDGATGQRYDFGSIQQCEQFADSLNAHREQTENEYERD